MHRLRGGNLPSNTSLSFAEYWAEYSQLVAWRRLAAACLALGVAALSYTTVWELHRAAQGEDQQLTLTLTLTPILTLTITLTLTLTLTLTCPQPTYLPLLLPSTPTPTPDKARTSRASTANTPSPMTSPSAHSCLPHAPWPSLAKAV